MQELQQKLAAAKPRPCTAALRIHVLARGFQLCAAVTAKISGQNATAQVGREFIVIALQSCHHLSYVLCLFEPDIRHGSLGRVRGCPLVEAGVITNVSSFFCRMSSSAGNFVPRFPWSTRTAGSSGFSAVVRMILQHQRIEPKCQAGASLGLQRQARADRERQCCFTKPVRHGTARLDTMGKTWLATHCWHFTVQGMLPAGFILSLRRWPWAKSELVLPWRFGAGSLLTIKTVCPGSLNASFPAFSSVRRKIAWLQHQDRISGQQSLPVCLSQAIEEIQELHCCFALACLLRACDCVWGGGGGGGTVGKLKLIREG